MADKPENRASLFTGERENSFFQSIQTEFNELVVQQSLRYYAVEKKYSRTHKLYQESKADEKVFRQPVELFGRITEEEPEQSTGRYGIDRKQTITVQLQRERVIKDLKFMPRMGDYIQYNNKFWEIYFANDDFGLIASQPLFKYAITIKATLARISNIKIIGAPMVDDINRGFVTGATVSTTYVQPIGTITVLGQFPIIVNTLDHVSTVSLSSSYVSGLAYDYRFLSFTSQLYGDVTGTLSSGNVNVVGIRGINAFPAGATPNQFLYYDGTSIITSAPPGSATITTTNGITSVYDGTSNTYTLGLSSFSGDSTGTLGAISTTGLRGIWIDPNTPDNGALFYYKGDRWTFNVLSGDLTGTVTSNNVVALRGYLIDSTSPSNGDILAFINGQWKHVTTSGDITGSITALSVTAMRGVVISPTTPTTTQVLTYDGNKWTPSGVVTNVIGICSLITSTNGTVIQIGSQNLQGDVTGSITASSVTAIRGIVISPTVPTATQVLTYDGNQYTPSSVLTNIIGICSLLVSLNGTVVQVGSQNLQGDITGSITSSSVTAIRGVQVNPNAPSTNQVLMYDGTKYSPTGHISNVIAASGLVALVNGTVISIGINSMSGDVTGSFTANSVTAIRGVVVSPTIPTVAQVLTYDGNEWTPSAVSQGSTTLAGDVTGNSGSNSVTAIRGFIISPSAPTTTQVLTYDGSKWTPSGVISNVVGICSLITNVNGSVIQVGTQNLQGDLTGSITSSSVTAIRGFVVSPTAPTVTQVLTFDGSKWTPSAVSQGTGGTLVGDVTGSLGSNSVTAIRGVIVSQTTPTTNQILMYDGAKYSPTGFISNVVGVCSLLISTNGTVIQVGTQNMQGDITGSITASSVTAIRGVIVSPTPPTTTQVLTYDGSKWTASSTITNIIGICSMLVSTNGTVISVGTQNLQGDITGSITAGSVTAIRGIQISPTAPTTTQVLTYDGSKWTSSGVISNVIGASGLVTLANGSVISVGIQSMSGDVTGSFTANSVTAIRGIVVSPTSPITTQVLTYDGSKWTGSGVLTNVIGICSLLVSTNGTVISVGTQTMQGDVTGGLTANSVTGIRGIAVSPTAPTTNQIHMYDGSKYSPTGFVSNVVGICSLLVSTNGTVISVGTQNLQGDITGSITASSVTAIRGIVVSPTAPTTTQVLTYDGSKYAPSSVLTNVIGVCSMLVSTNGTVISVGTQNLQGDVTGSITASSVTGLRGKPIDATAPGTNTYLFFDGNKWTASAIAGGSSVAMIGDVTGNSGSNSVTAIRGFVVSPTAPTVTQVLTYDGNKWTPSAVSQGAGSTLAGDVTGTLGSNSVTAIRGVLVSPTTPTTTQILMYDGSKYTPTGFISNVISASGLVTLVNGEVISIGIQNMSGDVTGSITSNSVTAIRNIVVSPTAPTTTQVLTYDGSKYTPSGVLTNIIGVCSMLASTNGTVISIGAQSLQGDVTGSITASSVTAIRGIVVSPTSPTTTQVLTYDGSKYTPSGVLTNIIGVCSLLVSTNGTVISIGTQNIQGDVTGSITSSSVTAIRGTAVSPTSPTTTQVLTYDGTKYTPSSVLTNIIGVCSLLVSTNGTVISVGTQTMQGDITGSITSSSVTAIRGFVVSPTIPTVTQVLTYDGSKWTPSAISQGSTTLVGDVTGNSGSNSVTAIRGFVISPTAPTVTQVLTFDGTKWTPSAVSLGAGATLGGDVTGSLGSNSVTGIRGILISPAVPSTSQVLTYDGSKWVASGVPTAVAVACNLSGDVTGSTTANSVTAIRGIVVAPTLPTVTQVLTYDGNKWTPSAVNQGAGSTLAGDVTGSLGSNSVTAIRGIIVAPTLPTTSQVLTYDGNKWTPSAVPTSQSQGTGITWNTLTDNAMLTGNNGYISTTSLMLSLSLPQISYVGQTIELVGRFNSGGWKLTQGVSQYIVFSNTATNAGVDGFIQSTDSADAIRLVCTSANYEFTMLSSNGNIAIGP